MKKIYSIVLMATMLLVGTNAWAKTITLGDKSINPNVDYETLRAAFENAENNDVIELVTPLSDASQPWFGETSATGASRSIKLDLKGNTYTYTGSKAVAITITRGKLEIVGPGKMTTAAKTDLIRVYGTYQKIDPKDGTPFAHLIIGPSVEIENTNAKANAVTVDVMREDQAEYLGYTKATFPLDYVCNFYEKISGGGHGVANGVKVEVYGNLTAKKYAIKVNGCIRLGKEFLYEDGSVRTKKWDKDKNDSVTVVNPFYAQTTATPAQYFEPKRSNEEYSITTEDGKYSPYVFIGSTARLVTNDPTSKDAVAVYSSGYGRFQIEGYCEGSSGVYLKSGEVVLNNATVTSNFEGTYTQPKGQSSGVNSGGSGIVMESNVTYSGSMSVAVEGDSHIEGTKGYAIDESVTTSTKTNVDEIIISGGTFVGGEKGTMVVTDMTATAAANPDTITTITIIGATATGQGKSGEITIGEDNLATWLSSQSTETHVTYVEVEPGKTVMVVSEGAAPSVAETKNTWLEIATNAASAIALDDTVNAVWNAAGTGSIETGNKVVLAELQMLGGSSTDGQQILTIKSGATLDVQRLMMNSYAQIIVEAGGMLIVEGDQGITATSNDNIILKASNTEQATFLINPKVQSNRHPNATVKMVAKGIGYLDVVNVGKSYFWHRFALPIKEATSWTKTPNVSTFVFGWNYNNDAWEQYSALTQMKPFQGLTMTAETTPLTDVEYTFKGQLAGGNDNQDLLFQRNGYNFFGNSYTGHISFLAIVNQLVADPMIDATVWAWRPTTQTYHPVPLLALSANPGKYEAWQKEVAPMNTFILKQNGAGTNTTVLNYADAVWNNPRYNGVKGNAPRRRVEAVDESTYMTIIVSAENGKTDFVMFTEDGQFSDEYENGYDGAKYMNENALNMYASVNGENYSVVATDNLEGKTLTINTVNNVNYTMTFENVNGAEYAVRDNATGAVFAIEEGASYEFAAQPNSVVEGRFEIIPVAKVPTAIDNTEAKADAKGIYTIMGQYVGEDFEVLPAGIYVVNGVKIVK